MRRRVNGRGDVLRQVSLEVVGFYKLLAGERLDELSRPAARLTFSRSSFFTLMVAEIVAQTISLINNPEVRNTRLQKNTPRRLTRIILTVPTAMPVREQRLLRSRAEAAVELVWDLMGWTEAGPPSGIVEYAGARCLGLGELLAICISLRWIAHKFGGSIEDFMNLSGQTRPFVDPNAPNEPPGAPRPSLRVGEHRCGRWDHESHDHDLLRGRQLRTRPLPEFSRRFPRIKERMSFVKLSSGVSYQLSLRL